jgi:hypothetical protein
MNPKLFAGSVSGINHSGSGQPGTGMNWEKEKYLIKFTISQQNAQLKKNFVETPIPQKALNYKILQ